MQHDTPRTGTDIQQIANLRFHKGLKAQGFDAAKLPFKSRLTRESDVRVRQTLESGTNTSPL